MAFTFIIGITDHINLNDKSNCSKIAKSKRITEISIPT
jgi:hypothetical protein